MKKYLLLIISGIFIYSGSFAQSSQKEVLFTINNKEYYKDGFIRTFKNKQNPYNEEKKSLKENLDIYVNLKLKVLEAEKLKIDSSSTFKRELLTFRRQLAQSYLTDSEVNEQLAHEAYERMKYDVKVSHILLTVPIDAAAEDTLRVYKKAIKVRNRIINNGEDFETIAKELSDDPSAKTNGGDLGYFTAFSMIYPFETAAYTTEVGDLSMPVRTSYGYHLLKIYDKRNAGGRIKIARIVVNVNTQGTEEESEQAKNNIFNFYKLLQSGETFSEVARKYSEDVRTSRNGGKEMNWISVGFGHPNFNHAAFALKNIGDYTEPVFDGYSWQIIQLLEKEDLPEFDKIKRKIESDVSRDMVRANISRKAIVSKLKKEYNFKEDSLALTDFYRVVDNNIFIAAWPHVKAKNLDKTLFTIDGKYYLQQDFALYLEKTMKKIDPVPISEYVDRVYNDFVTGSILDYEDNMLEAKYPEFKHLMTEFYEGNLLFELTNKMVWSKSQTDTVGLKDFFDKNRNNYMWGNRIDASIYTISSNEKLDEFCDEAMKLAEKSSKRNYSDEELNEKIDELCAKYQGGKIDIQHSVYAKGDNKIIDALTWKSGLSEALRYDDSKAFVYFNKLVDPQPKNLNDARGMITADYQAYLEKEWVAKLRKEYNLNINQDVLSKIEL
ncbi:peptidylprolyl isomerase [Bacteroidota bacterium]